MSTIERMVELLEPFEQTDAKPAGPNQPSRIERVIGRNAAHGGTNGPREFAAQLEADTLSRELKSSPPPAPPASRLSETLRVDRAHLLRQSIMTPNSDRTQSAESFRRIKRQILANVTRSSGGSPSNLVLVTSSLPGEGKTFCAVNLAISMALEMNRTVLLVDADVAKPSIPKFLGFRSERGLLDVLLDRQIDLSDVLCKVDIGKLTILPAGTAHPHATELLASDAMRTLLQEMAERYHDRIIIFDSPPLLAASEAAVLASQMGQIVMVVEAGKTSEAELKAALGRIETSNVTGLVLNKGDDPGPGYNYGEYGNPAR